MCLSAFRVFGSPRIIGRIQFREEVYWTSIYNLPRPQRGQLISAIHNKPRPAAISLIHILISLGCIFFFLLLFIVYFHPCMETQIRTRPPDPETPLTTRGNHAHFLSLIKSKLKYLQVIYANSTMASIRDMCRIAVINSTTDH